MLVSVWPTIVIVGAIAGATWSVQSKIALKDDVKADISHIEEAVIIAGSKADVALDRQMEALIAAIARLEAKPGKTPEDIAQLSYWRQQLQNLRKVRAGK